MNRRTDTLTPTIHSKYDYLTGTFSTRMNMLFKKKGMSEKSLYGNELTLYYTGKYQNVLDRAELVNSIFSFFTAFWRYIWKSASRSVCLFVRPYVRRPVGFFFLSALDLSNYLTSFVQSSQGLQLERRCAYYILVAIHLIFTELFPFN